MQHYQTNYSILEHAIGGMYFCKYLLFFRIARGVGEDYVSLHHGKVQVGKDQEKAQSEKDSHSKNRGGKKPN